MQVDLEKFHDEVQAFVDLQQLPSPESRYAALAALDPYPEIPSALLNSGHLASYAITTGMIDPFHVDALTKPATYLVAIEGRVTYLDDNGDRCAFFLSEKRSVEGEKDVRRYFELKPNSICYLTLQPKFRIPAYLAGRFNLLIRDVYRGLLVGTGPLVDPGFQGVLSIPVHNFTSKPYTLSAGEGFVYFEFSKLSWSNPEGVKKPDWVPRPLQIQPPFPVSKNNRRNLDDYIFEATRGGPAQNAIQQDIKKVTKLAKKANSRINLISVGSMIGAAIFLFTAIAVIVAGFQLYLGVQQFTQAAQKDVLESNEKLSMEVRSLRNEVDELKRAPRPTAPAR
jgi:deoxycytidine triphosphate deaminase